MSTCPIDHSNAEGKESSLPESHPPIPTGASAESCPYSAERQAEELSSLNHMPHPSQQPHPTQREALGLEREGKGMLIEFPKSRISVQYPNGRQVWRQKGTISNDTYWI